MFQYHTYILEPYGIPMPKIDKITTAAKFSSKKKRLHCVASSLIPIDIYTDSFILVISHDVDDDHHDRNDVHHDRHALDEGDALALHNLQVSLSTLWPKV